MTSSQKSARAGAGGIEKRGGYSGSKPAETMRPPAKLPAASAAKPKAEPRTS